MRRLSIFIIIMFSLALFGYGQVERKAEKLPILNLKNPSTINGLFSVKVQKDGKWQEVGSLAFGKHLTEKILDLSSFLKTSASYLLQITQQGGGAAYIDAVLLGGKAAIAARGDGSEIILRKTGQRDHDLIDAKDKVLQLTFPAAHQDRRLSLTARVENTTISPLPLSFPLENKLLKMSPSRNFYTYSLDSPADEKNLLFATYTPTGSGHPAGYTYAWARHDEKNLYVTLDFTPDNTMDGDKDYAKLFLKNGKQVKEYKITTKQSKWGTTQFTYTDKVPYQHKLYEFIIPRSEFSAAAGEGLLELAFEAYGTVALFIGDLDLAYDHHNNRYLVVYSPGVGVVANGIIDTKIYGQFVDPAGKPIGKAFTISGGGALAGSTRISPKVAYDPASHHFMVVWMDNRNFATSEWDIYGQIVNGDGTLFQTDALTNFPVCTSDFYQYNPHVACDTVNHRFLVVWQDDGSGGASLSDIYGGIFASNGRPLLPGSPTGFIISNAPLWQYEPRVAFDSLYQRFLVVFSSDNSGSRDIRGQMVNSDGTLFGTAADTNFLISTPGAVPSRYRYWPDVANDSVNHRFLVAWADPLTVLGPGTMDIYGQLVTGTGQLFHAAGHTQSFVISDADNDQLGVHLSFDSNQRRFLAVWTQSLPMINSNTAKTNIFIAGGELYGQFVNPLGDLLNTTSDTNFLIIGYESSEWGFWGSALDFNTRCFNFLVGSNNGPDRSYTTVGPACPELPEVTTAPVTDINPTSAMCGGEVTQQGRVMVKERGVCWNTTGEPTIKEFRTSDGTGTGSFESQLTNLIPHTTYHVRAYARNRVGVAYGEERTFVAMEHHVVTFVADRGGTLAGDTVQWVPLGGNTSPVEAKGEPGYFLLGWTGTGGFPPSNRNPLTVENVLSDMTITAHFATVSIKGTRLLDRSWLVSRPFGQIEMSISNTDPSLPLNFVLLRRQGDGEFKEVATATSSDLVGNVYTFYDKFLETSTTYTYQLAVYSADGTFLGVSNTITM